MKNILTEKIKEDFFITLYFNISEGFEKACLKRAYLDLNRTLKIKDGDIVKRKQIQNETQNYLGIELRRIVEYDIDSQESFDMQHKQLCKNLIDEWDELTYGQAQKWINMTLKYWLLLGSNRIPNIEKNSKYFHIPIDSYVQRGMFEEKYPKAWGKIDNYDDYFKYQTLHRDKKTGNPPIIDEFVFFNNYKK